MMFKASPNTTAHGMALEFADSGQSHLFINSFVISLLVDLVGLRTLAWNQQGLRSRAQLISSEGVSDLIERLRYR